jgi:DNA-binding response OmpR family regulator
VAETLTDEGYECFVARNVDAAVEIVKTTPEIILISHGFEDARENWHRLDQDC